MENVVKLAEELGYLKFPAGSFVELNKMKNVPDKELVVITTGSQGEPMSALARMADDEHRNVKLKRGDMVILYAQYFTTLALIAGGVERLCVELRHLQRTEVLEVEEGFAQGQKGSSAMPHKKNPISAENLTGLSRLVRSNALAAMENMALWHERDISHSSVERVIMPDSTILVDYMLHRLNNLLKGLRVIPENMERNLMGSHGLFFSQRVLLALVEAGLARQEAYVMVQKVAMRCWRERTSFEDAVRADADIAVRLDKAPD